MTVFHLSEMIHGSVETWRALRSLIIFVIQRLLCLARLMNKECGILAKCFHYMQEKTALSFFCYGPVGSTWDMTENAQNQNRCGDFDLRRKAKYQDKTTRTDGCQWQN